MKKGSEQRSLPFCLYDLSAHVLGFQREHGPIGLGLGGEGFSQDVRQIGAACDAQ